MIPTPPKLKIKGILALIMLIIVIWFTSWVFADSAPWDRPVSGDTFINNTNITQIVNNVSTSGLMNFWNVIIGSQNRQMGNNSKLAFTGGPDVSIALGGSGNTSNVSINFTRPNYFQSIQTFEAALWGYDIRGGALWQYIERGTLGLSQPYAGSIFVYDFAQHRMNETYMEINSTQNGNFFNSSDNTRADIVVSTPARRMLNATYFDASVRFRTQTGSGIGTCVGGSSAAIMNNVTLILNDVTGQKVLKSWTINTTMINFTTLTMTNVTIPLAISINESYNMYLSAEFKFNETLPFTALTTCLDIVHLSLTQYGDVRG